MNWLYIVLTLVAVGLLFGPMLYWDKGRRSLVLALRSLWLHKLRAFLSVLGIIIGTGRGHRADGLRRRQHAGRPGRHPQAGRDQHHRPQRQAAGELGTQSRTRVAMYGLTQDDYDRFTILKDGGTVTRMVPMRIFPQEMRRLHRSVHRPGRWHHARLCRGQRAADRHGTLPALERTSEQTRNVAVLGANVAASAVPLRGPPRTIADRRFLSLRGRRRPEESHAAGQTAAARPPRTITTTSTSR